MKKVIFLGAFVAAGFVSAKNAETITEAKEVTSVAKIYYHPITITSSCGYTQVIEVGPLDQQDCYLVDAQQMEDDCASPFTNPMLGMW